MALGKNVKQYREARGLTQQELSDLTGGEVSQGAIAALEKRDSAMSRFAPTLAKALQVSYAELTGVNEVLVPFDNLLAEETATYATQGAVKPAGLVPLISSVQAGEWCDIVDHFAPGDAEDWYPCPVRHGPNTFCLTVEGESMRNPGSRPSYEPGDIIFVDPDVALIPGARAVFRLEGQTKATFKQYIEEDGRKLLKALNPEWSPRYIEINGHTTVCGVVIGKWVPE